MTRVTRPGLVGLSTLPLPAVMDTLAFPMPRRRAPQACSQDDKA